MGQELACTVRLGKRKLTGKVQLETDFILFRGDERLKLLFQDLTSVEAQAGVLRLDFPGGPAEFQLGAAAEKWARKILNPPTRLDKLGVKPETAVTLVGPFDPDFQTELAAAGARKVRKAADIIFLSAPETAALDRVASLLNGLHPDGAIWVVFPKGVKQIREIEVIEAGRAAGLKDVKVARFSATHTALKFVRPLGARAAPRAG